MIQHRDGLACPRELDDLRRTASFSMQIEEAALKKETDALSQSRLAEICKRSWPSCGTSSAA